ncbi:hypothetical protein, partial [Segatella sp.]|uniref:hypothetical protein n=1 Tax=Segatella sp. TaxID=2974253 RepID=UPI003AB561C5
KAVCVSAETVAASTSLIDDTKIQHSRTPNYAICAICRDSGKKVEKSGIFIERFCPNIQNSLK